MLFVRSKPPVKKKKKSSLAAILGALVSALAASSLVLVPPAKMIETPRELLKEAVEDRSICEVNRLTQFADDFHFLNWLIICRPCVFADLTTNEKNFLQHVDMKTFRRNYDAAIQRMYEIQVDGLMSPKSKYKGESLTSSRTVTWDSLIDKIQLPVRSGNRQGNPDEDLCCDFLSSTVFNLPDFTGWSAEEVDAFLRKHINLKRIKQKGNQTVYSFNDLSEVTVNSEEKELQKRVDFCSKLYVKTKPRKNPDVRVNNHTKTVYPTVDSQGKTIPHPGEKLR